MTSHAREGHKAERREPSLIPAAAPADVPPQSPLDFTLAVMRDPLKPDALRASLAKAALPYVHGRWCPLGSDPRDAKPKLPPSVETHDDSLIRHARPCAGHPRLEHHSKEDVDGRVKPGHDENKERSLAPDNRVAQLRTAEAEDRARTLEQRAIAAEARMRDMEQRAAAAEARLAELVARESASEALLARVKAEWPDIFDASGAVRAPCVDERDMFAQLVEAQERARSLENRAVMAEGRLREAQRHARDMEERACASEELIAGRR